MALSRSQRWCLAVFLVPKVISSFLPITRIRTTHHHCHTNHPLQAPSTRILVSAETASDDVLYADQNRTTITTSTSTSTSASTLSLLEHVNFNVPNHDCILDFYLDLLGCGLDPRVAVNLMEDNDKRFGREGLIWVSCGPHQFHFPRDTTAQGQVLSGHIGLRYKSLEGLKKRLMTATTTKNKNKNKKQCFVSYDIVVGPEGETIHIQDCYGNVFHCREGPELCTQYRQSVLKRCDQDIFGDVALRYGIQNEGESECRGIDHVELNCPMGTAEQIALFYESIFDATTMVVREENNDNNSNNSVAAYISIGEFEVTTGRASQYLIFRETPSPLPAYDGHHIALYIGTAPHDTKNFERAFHKAQNAGLLSTNWRDKADVLTLEAARSQHQFRIETILDRDTGQPIFQLEHEIRSVEHSTWPGRAKKEESTIAS